MSAVVISGTGLYQPPHTITNDELVASFNAYVDVWNTEHAAEIESGTCQPLTHSSSEFIEKTLAQFPEAKVTRCIGPANSTFDVELGDEIPF